MNTCLAEDISYLVENTPVLKEFAGKSVLVTGATGLIGSMIVKTLCAYEEKENSGLTVYALVRNQEKAKLIFEDCMDRIRLVVGDVNFHLQELEHLDYIIHSASVTSSRMFVSNPVETITTLIQGTKNVLDLGKSCGVNKILYLSSLEVYGIPNVEEPLSEDYVGYIDFTAVRSSYSEGKRMAECLCNCYASQHDIPVVTARLTQTFGPGVDYYDKRVFAEFARAVLEGKDIVLNTAGRTYRSYCYLRDAVSAVFYILAKGASMEAYNVANKNTGITIADMAEMVCESQSLGAGKIQVLFHTPNDLGALGYNPEMKISLNTEKLEDLGWRAEVGLEQMYVRMIYDMALQKRG